MYSSRETLELRRFHAGHGYRGFDRLFRSVEKELASITPTFLGYEKSAVVKRLTQRLVEISLNSYLREGASLFQQDKSKNSVLNMYKNYGGVRINASTAKIKPSTALVVRSIVGFLAHWTYVLGVSFWSKLCVGQKPGPAALVFGVGAESLKLGGDDIKFVEFCRKGPILPLSTARRLIVQSVEPLTSSDQDFVLYDRFPLLRLMRENSSSMSGLLSFVQAHVGVLVSYFISVIRSPLIATLGHDFAYHAVASRMNCRGHIEAVVITNSNYPSQPLWMSNLPGSTYYSHMVWYSQNAMPLVYQEDGIEADMPSFRYIRVSNIWVWTRSFGAYLKKLGVLAKIHFVGPILWYLPNKEASFKSDSEIRISVFDVTPVTPAAERKYILFYNYYRTENVTQFINGIVKVCGILQKKTSKKVRIILKHKREHHPIHDPQYISLIQRLRDEGVLELADPAVDMFSMLQASDLAIVMPYSSPAYVARHVNTPAIYYDPVGELKPRYEEDPLIEFAQGENALMKSVQNMCSEFV